MNTAFDLKVGKLRAAEIYSFFTLTALKIQMPPNDSVCTCLLNVQLHREYSTEPDLPRARGIIRRWLGDDGSKVFKQLRQ